MTSKFSLVVVGGSVASEALTTRLSELNYTEQILVLDADQQMPYERPPLSKNYMISPDLGDIEIERDAADVPITYGRAISIDADNKKLTYIDSETEKEITVEFANLVIATGATPIHLPFEPEGVSTLRTRSDSDDIHKQVTNNTTVGIIGAGVIGAELATSLKSLGANVTLIDKADIPLQRLLNGHLGEWINSSLQDFGIECILGADIVDISGSPKNWKVALGDGQILTFEVLISAVGVRPEISWLNGSGLLNDGVLTCNQIGAVTVQGKPVGGIYAIGDVATRQLADGTLERTENWTAAAEHGARLAEFLVGDEPAEPDTPYFWTDVFGKKIQILGQLPSKGNIETEYEDAEREAILYKVSDGETIGWIGINAQRKIAMLRYSS